MLTLFGAIAIGLGILASERDWLAMCGAIVVGVLSELPLLANGPIAAIRRALLLAFMFAVARRALVAARAQSVPVLMGGEVAFRRNERFGAHDADPVLDANGLRCNAKIGQKAPLLGEWG
jgi:hypothetical protein